MGSVAGIAPRLTGFGPAPQILVRPERGLAGARHKIALALAGHGAGFVQCDGSGTGPTQPWAAEPGARLRAVFEKGCGHGWQCRLVFSSDQPDLVRRRKSWSDQREAWWSAPQDRLGRWQANGAGFVLWTGPARVQLSRTRQSRGSEPGARLRAVSRKDAVMAGCVGWSLAQTNRIWSGAANPVQTRERLGGAHHKIALGLAGHGAGFVLCDWSGTGPTQPWAAELGARLRAVSAGL